MEIPHLDPGVGPQDRLDTMNATLFAAGDRLGLKLVRQKNAAETIVVESAVQVPTEN